MMIQHSLLWFLVLLTTACVLFALVMVWFKERDEDKAYREGIEDAKKHIIENGL